MAAVVGEHPGRPLLKALTAAAGVPFDTTLADQALRAADRDIPPTQTRAARTRATQAAERLGVQLLMRQLSVREALSVVAYESPLAAFAIGPNGHARWFLLAEARGGSGRLERLETGDGGEWLKANAIADQLGAAGPDTVLEWLLPQPVTPILDSGRAQGESDHNGHGGHGGHGGHAEHMSPLKRLWLLLQPERRDLWVVFVYAVFVGVLNLITPITAMAVVNTAALASLTQQLIVLCLALFVALGLAAFLTVLETIVVEYMQQRTFVRVAADLSYRLPRVEMKAFDHQHGPELVNRFFDVLTVQKAGATLLLDGLTIALQTIIGLVLLAFYHQFLLGFDLILIGCLLFMFFVLGRGAVKSAIRESIAKYRVAGWMQEIARNPLAFKLSGGPRFASEKTDQLTKEYLMARQSHFRRVLTQFGFAMFLQAAASVALLGIGGYLVVQGQLSLGQLVAAEIVVTLVVASFTKLGKQLESYYDLMSAIDKLGHLMDLPLERNTGVPHHPVSQGAAVDIKGMSFAYHPGHDVFEHFQQSIKPGERIALLGPNGSGKTTLMDLLFGLRTPTHGWIEIDGVDLRELKLDSVRSHIAEVKHLEVFEGSVLANVRMGRDDVSLYDVRKALADANLLETVMNLPDGLNTNLTTSGAPLSMGQATRLMLARAIVGQPRLLLLDETLDNMDADTREKLIPVLFGREARWTLIVITHSAEIAAMCDRAIKLEKADHSHGHAELTPAAMTTPNGHAHGPDNGHH